VVYSSIRRKAAMYLPVIARDEILEDIFPLDEDCQCRCLYPTYGRLMETTFLRVECSHGASAVYAHQPVGFRAAYRRFREWLHGFVIEQFRKTIPDRSGRHRLQPKPFYRFAGPRMTCDVPKDQLPFTPCVTGVD